MPTKSNHVVERIQRFETTWNELAAGKSFAGMTLAQFKTATAGSVDERTQLGLLDAMYSAAVARRKKADTGAIEKMVMVADAVRGDPDHGRDSALYRALGYVPKSERRSGLTRKSKTAATAPTRSTGTA